MQLRSLGEPFPVLPLMYTVLSMVQAIFFLYFDRLLMPSTQ